MTEHTTILVPVRYPLTDDSARTLAVAGRLADDRAPADLCVLHVNLYQDRDKTRPEELTRAISSTLEDVEVSVTTRRGFLVEEVVLTEATQIDADLVVVGSNQQATWRKLLRRLLRTDPEITSFLRDNTTDEVDVVEVDTTAETPTVEPV